MLLHMQTTPTDLITTREAADILRESIYTTLRRVPAGELTPVTKLPGIRGAFLFSATDVTALRAKLTTSTPADQPSPEAGSAGVSSLGGDAA